MGTHITKEQPAQGDQRMSAATTAGWRERFCPACASDALRTLYWDPEVRVHVCRTCQLMSVAYVHGPPDPQGVFTREYFQRNYLGSRETLAVPLWNEILDALEEMVPTKGRLVDVGCGVGTFLLQARRRGWDTWGVDISADAVALARGRGLAVEAGRLPQLDWSAGSVDVLTFFESLVYEADLGGTLQAGQALLRNGGVLVVKANWLTPRSVRLLHLLSGALARRPYARATMHVSTSGASTSGGRWLFTPENMTALLGRFGFAVRQVRLLPLPPPSPGRRLGWLVRRLTAAGSGFIAYAVNEGRAPVGRPLAGRA